MLNLRKFTILLGFATTFQANAGYLDCTITPRFYQAAENKMIVYKFCSDTGEQADMPSGFPTNIAVQIFSSATSNKNSYSEKNLLTLLPDFSSYQNDLAKAGGDKSKVEKALREQFQVKIDALEKSWKATGYVAFDFDELKPADTPTPSKMPSSTLYLEKYFQWPSSSSLIGWSIKISGGKIRQRFSMYQQTPGSKKKLIPVKLEQPDWNYSGPQRFRVFVSKDKKVIYSVFDNTWSGSYLIPTPKQFR